MLIGIVCILRTTEGWTAISVKPVEILQRTYVFNNYQVLITYAPETIQHAPSEHSILYIPLHIYSRPSAWMYQCLSF